jgi:MazG family protein
MKVSYFKQLQQRVRALLGDDAQIQCSWLKQQTFRSIANYSLEEIYELIDAIDTKDVEAIRDELADMCFHLVIYTQLNQQGVAFDLEDLAQHALNKLDSRQPKDTASMDLSPDDRHQYWQTQKHQARFQRSGSVLSSVPQHVPSMMQSVKILEAVAQFGFKFNDTQVAIDKLNEEVLELQQAFSSQSKESMYQELGDVMLACMALSRELDINPEEALKAANTRFSARILRMEQLMKEQSGDLFSLDQAQLKALYESAKER